jgi:capsular exopolysaccharide synthesis family protein
MDDDLLSFSDEDAVSKPADMGDTIRKVAYRLKSLLYAYWWILILGAVAGLLVKALEVRKLKDSYESYAQLMIQGQIEISEGDRMREVATNFHDNQLHLMRQASVKQRAIERVRALHPDVVAGWVELSADRNGTTDVFFLSARGDKPLYTQLFLDQLIEAYLESRRQVRLETSDDVLLSIDEELRELEVSIELTQEEIRRFQHQNNTVAIRELSESATANLTEVTARMEDLRTQQRIMDSFNESASLEQIQDVVNLEALQSTQNFRDTQRQYQNLLALKDTLGIYLRPKHPRMIDISSDLEMLSNRLEVFRKQAFIQLEDQKRSIQTRIVTMEPQVQKWRDEVFSYSNKLNEFDALRSKLERMQITQDKLMRRKEALNIGRAVDTELISKLQSATPAQLKRVDKLREMAEGGLIGLMLGAALVALLAVLNNKIACADDVRSQFDGKVIGLIPKAEGKVTLIKKESNHVFAESFRSLRSSILMHKQDASRPMQVLLVTSCAPAEGKSTVSSNLAAILAYSGARTILVDCDLRRGHLHDKFGIPRAPGLAELLEDEKRQVSEVTLVGDQAFQNLSVIPAGKASDNPGDLFLTKRMDVVLEQLRGKYDFVVLDTAPVLAVDDTIGLLKRADDIIFVVKSSQTTFRQLKLALDRISVSRRKVWGFVLNYVSASGADYYYYSRYKSYRYHENETKKSVRKKDLPPPPRKGKKIALT